MYKKIVSLLLLFFTALPMTTLSDNHTESQIQSHESTIELPEQELDDLSIPSILENAFEKIKFLQILFYSIIQQAHNLFFKKSLSNNQLEKLSNIINRDLQDIINQCNALKFSINQDIITLKNKNTTS